MNSAKELINAIFNNINKLIRYFAPGFIAVLLWLALDDSFLSGQDIYGQLFVPMIVVGSLLLGIVLYAFHSHGTVILIWLIIVYIFKRRFLKRLSLNEKFKEYSNGRSEFWCILGFFDMQRWKRRASGEKKVVKYQQYLDNWAALLHLLYSTAFTLIIMPILINRIQGVKYDAYDCLAIWSGAVMGIAILFSEYRFTFRKIDACNLFQDV